MNTTSRPEFVLGWHPAAEQAARNMGLSTSVVDMPSGYAARLYVSGDRLAAFRSLPQVRRQPRACVFSPSVYMPRWTEI